MSMDQIFTQRLANLLTFIKAKVTFVFLLFLFGCGGGGKETTTPTPPTTPIEYTIQTEVSTGGTITPQRIAVGIGSDTSFKLQPETGYELDNINGCSGKLTGLQYDVININSNCTIRVVYRKVQTAPERITAVVGSNQATITWPAIENVKTYKVYYATQPFDSLAELPNSVVTVSTTTPSISIALKKSFNNYYVRVSAVFGDIELLSTEQLQVVLNFKPIGGLNDTATIYCLSTQLSIADCQSDFSQKQDGGTGRDAQAAAGNLTKLGVGSAGFDFSKIDRNGEPLLIQDKNWSDSGNELDGSKWSCARDNVTGLVWEIKQPDGINGKGNVFSWLNNSSLINNGVPGDPGNNLCGLSQCNTASYIEYLNGIRLCGSTNWRLPTRAELVNIIMNTGTAPRLDPLVFPDVQGGTSYWTSSTYFPTPHYAWAVSMNTGIVYWQQKQSLLSIRLVHSE